MHCEHLEGSGQGFSLFACEIRMNLDAFTAASQYLLGPFRALPPYAHRPISMRQTSLTLTAEWRCSAFWEMTPHGQSPVARS